MERKEELRFGGAAMSLPVDLSCLQGGGGAEGEAALAALEKQLICPICLELFNKPVVILPCQHNLCRKCANELYQPSLFQARTTMLINSGRFRCPSCRHEVVLDRHGVYGLQRNLLVENIIDVYKQEVSNIHNKEPSPLPPPPPPPPPAAAQLTCSDHEGEKVNIYCLNCQVPTCSLCKVFGAHQSCKVAPLTDVYQQQKDELSNEVGALRACNDKIQALIDELEETCRTIEENSKTQKQIVSDKFSHVFSILEERQKSLTQRISSEQEEKTGHAQALVRCYGDKVDANNKLVERATSSMEEPDMAAFVQNSRELITKVLAATGSCPAETLRPGYESLSDYRYNFSRQERALRSLDFPRVVEDVPEEPEVEGDPEQNQEPSVQTTEPKDHQETPDLESAADAVKESIPAVTPPPVEPVAPVAPAAGLVRDSVEPAGPVLQPQTDGRQFNAAGSGQVTSKEEEERERAEGCAAPDPVKDGNICDGQEGMSTQQCGGAENDAGDRTTQSETEEKHDAQDDEEVKTKEEAGASFYPGWYKPSSRRRVGPVPAENQPEIDDTETKTWRSGPQTEVENLEEEDMQGWVCVPGAADTGFSLIEGSFHLGESSSGSFSANNAPSTPPEEAGLGVERGRSETYKGNFELHDGKLEDAEGEQHVKSVSGLVEFEAESMDASAEKGLEKAAGSTWEDGGISDDVVENPNRLLEGDGDAEFEAGSSGFEAKTDEDGDFTDKVETSAAETGEKVTSADSLQMQTETRSPAQTGPPSSSSSSSSSSSPSGEAPRRPSFCFSWLNPLHKKK